jgi:hypothetical protein
VGRKKVDIRPIPEGRKRQVTFMKRKTGLLKKAMELSILCQCEMAVVIFNHNGKLYDYGSTNIHKTIRRFKNKGKPDGSYEPEVRVHATGAAPQLHRCVVRSWPSSWPRQLPAARSP